MAEYLESFGGSKIARFGFELPVPRHSKLCDRDRGMRPRKSVRTLGPWWKRTGRLPLDLGALGCLSLDIFSSRSLYPPPSQFWLYAGGGTKPPISAASSRANSIVVESSPSGPMI